GDDLVAVGLIDSLEARGVQVPRDVSVVGFDDIALAGVGRIGLTTVRQPAHEIGAAAARMLVAQLDAAPAAAPVLREPPLAGRYTTAPPGASGAPSPGPRAASPSPPSSPAPARTTRGAS